MQLTAIFESWHIGDGNYPPLRRGQEVNLSFEVEPSVFDSASGDAPDTIAHLGGGDYEFTGTVARRYCQSDEPLFVIECGDFRFYINRRLQFSAGDRIRGKGKLVLDHYLWVEFLERYEDPPDLFYQLVVQRIRRVRIPTPVHRAPRGWEGLPGISRARRLQSGFHAGDRLDGRTSLP